jgi:hypothetical protein
MDGTRGLRLIDAAGDTTFYAKAAAARASDNFSVYLGKYYSEETSSFLSVFQSGGKLKLSFKPTQEYELVHTIKNGFIVPATGTVLNFTKRGKRKATLKISVPRARNVEFIKVPASNKKN